MKADARDRDGAEELDEGPGPGPGSELAAPVLFLNRELSSLEFNRRVLAQACDAQLPLLERVRFLTICSSNLDEFFEVRVAGLQQQLSYGLVETGADGQEPAVVLEEVARIGHELVEEQYRVLNEELLPELEAEDVRILEIADWSEGQQRWIARYFKNEVLPVLAPMGLDPAHPFPRTLNKSLNFIVEVEGTAVDEERRLRDEIVQARSRRDSLAEVERRREELGEGAGRCVGILGLTGEGPDAPNEADVRGRERKGLVLPSLLELFLVLGVRRQP